MHRLLFVGLLLVWFAMRGGVALAQQQPDLTVTLHDVANAPLAGIMVIVRDASGTRDLARAATDAQGVATFSGLTESQVRVGIAGTLPNGTRLYQPGNDVGGIRLLLDPAPTTLDLRSAADGMIVPDPATMAAQEPGIPVATGVAVVPTAPIATRIPVAQATLPTSAPASGGAAAPAVPIDRDTPADGGREQVWLGLGLLTLLIGAGVGIALVQRRSV